MTYRLIALDLDGTVMASDLVVLPAVRRAIAAARGRGIRVTLATGRSFGATIPFARDLGIDTPLICYQGALVRHPVTGEVYHHAAVPGPLAAEAAAALLAAGIFVIAYIDEAHYVAERRPELDLYLRYHPEGGAIVVAPDLAARVAATPPTKLLFVAEAPVVTAQLAALSARFAGRLTVVRSHELFGELTPPATSKGIALAELARQLGIPREQVVAIGDQENDLSMVAWAGLGLAMGNAIPAVKDAAAAVLPPVTEGGVAIGIARYVLGEG